MTAPKLLRRRTLSELVGETDSYNLLLTPTPLIPRSYYLLRP
jgi:hypothetical protein